VDLVGGPGGGDCARIAFGGRCVFLPYNRIDVEQEGKDYALAVNRDFHQYMHDNSDATLRDPAWTEEDRRILVHRRLVYDAPFVINPVRARALVVGAGTGNDVQAALRQGYGQVLSVDIDGRIIELGRRLHPERPYDDPRAVPVVNDARAFLRAVPGRALRRRLLRPAGFARDVLGALVAAPRQLRLHGGGNPGRLGHVSERGHLTISFSLFPGPWLGERLYWTIARATGVRPVMLYHGLLYGVTYVVARPGATLDLAPLAAFQRMEPRARSTPCTRLRTTGRSSTSAPGSFHGVTWVCSRWCSSWPSCPRAASSAHARSAPTSIRCSS
jgi:hypothetical protein